MRVKPLTMSELGANGDAVLSAFFSEFIFKVLRTKYHDSLAILVLVAATLLWVKLSDLLTMLFAWLQTEKDDERWLFVWYTFLNGVHLILVFLWGQYFLVLLETDIALHNTSVSLVITFVLVVRLVLLSGSVLSNSSPRQSGITEQAAHLASRA